MPLLLLLWLVGSVFLQFSRNDLSHSLSLSEYIFLISCMFFFSFAVKKYVRFHIGFGMVCFWILPLNCNEYG